MEKQEQDLLRHELDESSAGRSSLWTFTYRKIKHPFSPPTPRPVLCSPPSGTVSSVSVNLRPSPSMKERTQSRDLWGWSGHYKRMVEIGSSTRGNIYISLPAVEWEFRRRFLSLAPKPAKPMSGFGGFFGIGIGCRCFGFVNKAKSVSFVFATKIIQTLLYLNHFSLE